MVSLWRNDGYRRLAARAEHLLHKSYRKLRWIWVVGDSNDNTFALLNAIAGKHKAKSITVLNHVTNGRDRYERLSLSVNMALAEIQATDDLVMIHESDIESPRNVIQKLIETGKMPVAGWPTLTFPDGTKLFYDIWAFRANGKMFKNWPPYHNVYDPDALFEVDSFGTVWLFPAEEARNGLRCYRECTLELCQKLKERGHRMWVDPTVEVVQPYDLWETHRIKDGEPHR
jgi:hypothetical protein